MNVLIPRDDKLQAETQSPKIPRIDIREPDITNQTVRRDKVGSVSPNRDDSSGFDISNDLSENNVRMQYVNTQSLGRDD